MADSGEGEGNILRKNEWEVVSLTASAYAAAPGPKEVEVKDDSRGKLFVDDSTEMSGALFMSGHFVFPPNEHENPPPEPVKPDESEISSEHAGKGSVSESELVAADGGRFRGKDEDDLNLKGLDIADEFAGINLMDKKQSLYDAATFGSLHSKEALGGSATYVDSAAFSELTEASQQGSDFAADMPQFQKPAEDESTADSDLPCEAWWKQKAVSLYTHAKEANTFWSIFIASAVMGLVILGQQWQQERWQSLQLKWQLTVNIERTGWMLGPFSRLKAVIVGRPVRGSLSSSSSN